MAATYQKKSITLELAQALIAVAADKARELGDPMCIAVCDEEGNLKAFVRMDGAPYITNDTAYDKAYTAAGLKKPSGALWDMMKNDPPLLYGLPSAVERLITLPGGLPIVIDGQTVGGIGASAAHYSKDLLCVEAAIEALPRLLEELG